MSKSEIDTADPSLLVSKLTCLDQARKGQISTTVSDAEAQLATVINQQLTVCASTAQSLRSQGPPLNLQSYRASLRQILAAYDLQGTQLGDWWEQQLNMLDNESYPSLSLLERDRLTYLSAVNTYVGVLTNAQGDNRPILDRVFSARMADIRLKQGQTAYGRSGALVEQAGVRYDRLLQECYTNPTQQQQSDVHPRDHDQMYESEWGTSESTACGSEDEQDSERSL